MELTAQNSVEYRLTGKQLRKLSLFDVTEAYIHIPTNPVGGSEVEVVDKNCDLLTNLTMEQAFKL